MSQKLSTVFLFIITTFAINLIGHGQLQAQNISHEWGLDAQQYPTGTILTLRSNWPSLRQLEAEFRMGVNIVYHGDAGVHQNEEGLGFGLSLGGRYWFKPHKTGWHVGARCDFWRNQLDWWDEPSPGMRLTGETTVLVVQPTAFVAYDTQLSERWRIVPNLAFGAEINTWQEGEDVGQGAILLIGLQLVRR